MNVLSEKSKQRMIGEDIAEVLRLVKQKRL
jgi:hypothetical protein